MHNLFSSITRTDKNGKEITKTVSCNLLIAQDLWQAHYRILSIILLKEFIKLNVDTDTVVKYVKLSELNKTIATAFLNIQTLKMA